MKINLILFFTFFLGLFVANSVLGAKKNLSLVIKTDTSKILVKSFNKAKLSKYKKDKDFNYKGTSINEPSALDLFWIWVWRNIELLFGRTPFVGSFLRYLFFIVAIVFLIFMVFKAIGIDTTMLLTGKSQKTNNVYNEVVENIFEIDFDAEIEKAISKNNFRLAVRMHYLKCLKQMSDKGLINWQENKTNANYLTELTNTDQKQLFSLLTKQFEYVWYGNFLIDKDGYYNISEKFQNFNIYLG